MHLHDMCVAGTVLGMTGRTDGHDRSFPSRVNSVKPRTRRVPFRVVKLSSPVRGLTELIREERFRSGGLKKFGACHVNVLSVQ